MGHRTIWRWRTSKLATPLAVLALVAVVVPLSLVAHLPITGSTPKAAAADPTCESNVIYNLISQPLATGTASANNGNVYALNTDTATNSNGSGAVGVPMFTFGNANNVAVNGLGVTPDANTFYAVTQVNGARVWVHNAATNTNTDFPGAGGTPSITMVMGAVDPGNGFYYYAGYTGTTGTSARVLAIFAFNPTSHAVARVGDVSFGIAPASSFVTGDLAFDAVGNMYVVAGTNNTGTNATNTYQVRRVTGPIPTTGPAGTLSSTILATDTTAAGAGFWNGIAFAADGSLWAQYAVAGSATLADLNVDTGVATNPRSQNGVPTTPSPPGILTDLAGCSFPPTLTVQKDLPDGRAATDDQFTMTVTGDGITEGNTATTTGSATGVQDAKVGPRPAIAGTTYTMTEEMAQEDGTSINAYTSTLACVDENTGASVTVGSNTGTSGTVTFPTPATGSVEGAQIVCTFTNVPVAPTLTLSKELGGRGRVLATDQFTMQIQNPPGTVVGDTTNATTTGTGATVDTGTGVTTLSPADAGTAYTMTEVGAGTPTADLTNYTSVIQCRDVNGVQPESELPNEPFNPAAPPSVTPAAGADIDCVITNLPLAEPVLELNKALGSDRVRDTDQFTVAVLVGSETGPSLGVEGNVDATTSGVGAVVEPGTGTTGFLPVTVSTPTAYFLTETPSGSTVPSSYTSTVTCVDLEGRQTTGLPTDVPLSDNPSVTPTNLGSVISCTITNTAIQPTLQLSKALPGGRANAGDQFTMQILADDQTTVEADATTAGSGTTVTGGVASLTPATAGDTYFLDEIGAGTTNLAQYSSTITCTDANGVQTGLPNDEPLLPFEIMPVLGASISCTITNTPISPNLELDKALGSSRAFPGDQFTMQIQNPPGAVVGDTTNATTTGTGAAVDAGTGVTTLSPANAGTTYTLAEVGAGSPLANLAAYTATITCVDTEELQTDLPVDAPFTGSTTITPVAGASISCTVTNTAKPVVNLSVTKTSSPNPYTQGHTLTYTVVVRNAGPTTAAPATVDDPMPIQLAGAGFTWTCVATTGSACGAASGVAPLHDTPTIVAGGSVTYTLTGTVPAATAATLTNIVTVTPPPDAFDAGCVPDCTATNVTPLASVSLISAVSPLARTGAYILRIALLAAALLGAGIVLVLLGKGGIRRRARHAR